jgi:hypothetical protein
MKPDLLWVKGPHGLGCDFHRVATFAWESVRGTIHVFVNPGLTPDRPIAVTLKVAVGPSSKTNPIEEGIDEPSQAVRLSGRLNERLIELGCDIIEAASLAEAVAEFIRLEDAAIRLALKKSSH